MSVTDVCHVCGGEATKRCENCGGSVCQEHYAANSRLCVECEGGRKFE